MRLGFGKTSSITVFQTSKLIKYKCTVKYIDNVKPSPLTIANIFYNSDLLCNNS